MCGLTGIVCHRPDHNLAEKLRQSLLKIQHRGYDGAGLVLDDHKYEIFRLIKNTGMIPEALSDELITGPLRVCPKDLSSDTWLTGIAHTRYKTCGDTSLNNVQPLISASAQLALVHNGQVNNTNLQPDSRQILEIWQKYEPLVNLKTIQAALKDTFETIEGSYSCLLLIKNYGLVAFRDPLGIRPLVWGQFAGGWALASESVALTNSNVIRDILPGTGLLFRPGVSYPISLRTGSIHSGYRAHSGYKNQFSLLPCLFEFIYLADPDSVIDGLSVRRARTIMGRQLAKKIRTLQLQIDLIVPVPDSSCIATRAVAKTLGLPYRELIKLNPGRKQSRSFILPTQSQREIAVRDKFSFAAMSLANDIENLLIVDDSIVRGTTMRHLISAIRQTYPNFKKIYVASVAPVIRRANIFGIDIPDDTKLLAYQKTIPEIAVILGADQVIYQDLNDMERALLLSLDDGNLIAGFEDSIFQ